MLKFRILKPAGALLLCSLFCPALASVAHAQDAAAPVEPPPALPAAPPAAAEPGPAAPRGDAAELARLRAEVEANKQAIAELKAVQEEAAAAASEEPVAEQEKLKIYGFADMGFQYVQIKKQALLANVYDVTEPDFVLGNLNLYFDAQPVENWRGLTEVRFTNAPQGKITNFGWHPVRQQCRLRWRRSHLRDRAPLLLLADRLLAG